MNLLGLPGAAQDAIAGALLVTGEEESLGRFMATCSAAKAVGERVLAAHSARAMATMMGHLEELSARDFSDAEADGIFQYIHDARRAMARDWPFYVDMSCESDTEEVHCSLRWTAESWHTDAHITWTRGRGVAVKFAAERQRYDKRTQPMTCVKAAAGRVTVYLEPGLDEQRCGVDVAHTLWATQKPHILQFFEYVPLVFRQHVPALSEWRVRAMFSDRSVPVKHV